ncbi:MAG: dihydroneopterin aldolase, partial [Hyphomonadaceae bacterium]
VLQRVEVEAQVGIHPWERYPEHPTRLLLDLTLTFDYAAYYEKHGGYVSYDGLRAFLGGLRAAPHTDKLETLAARILKRAFEEGADRVRLQILKPDIFHEMDGVGLVFDVSRAEFEAHER